MTAIDQKIAFKQRVRHWVEKLDVKVVWLGVRPMRNKWASCSTAGHLNFNDELLAFDQDLWDYVIVHELLHFFVPNHGRLWKSLMRAHLGDYEDAQRRLSGPADWGNIEPRMIRGMTCMRREDRVAPERSAGGQVMDIERITHDPAVMGGKPCIRGLRVTVGTVLGLLASGHSRERILAAYPYLEAPDIDAVLAYAAWRMEEREEALVGS